MTLHQPTLEESCPFAVLAIMNIRTYIRVAGCGKTPGGEHSHQEGTSANQEDHCRADQTTAGTYIHTVHSVST